MKEGVDYGGPMTPEYIIVHHTGSSASGEAIEKYFEKDDVYLSSHYIVDRDGHIRHLVPDNRIARHAGSSSYDGKVGFNNFSLGIEVASDGYNFTEAQKLATRELILELMNKHNIDNKKVLRHADIAPDRKWDIGPNFYKEFETWENYQLSLVNMNKCKDILDRYIEDGYNPIFEKHEGDKPLTEAEVKTLIDIAFKRFLDKLTK